MHGRLLCRALAAHGASRLTRLPAHAVCLSVDARSPTATQAGEQTVCGEGEGHTAASAECVETGSRYNGRH